MDEIGYVTLTEANEYVTSHYVAQDKLRLGWEGLSDEDRTALLNRSYSIINSLPLRGRKADPEQEGAFPRCPSSEVPKRVKDAQVELALAYTDTDKTTAVAEYKQKADYGISSYRIGNFSETLLSYANYSLQMQYGLISTEAERLLMPWLYGGFRIE